MNDYGFTWTTSEELVPALSLRDKFAMAALTGLLAGNEHDALCRYEKTAELAYQLADAMMEARGIIKMQQIKLNEPETLPTDGTIVLLFLHDGTVCNAFFSNVAPTNDAKDDGEYDWVCCEDRFLIDGHDTHLIRGWLPLCYFEGFV